MAQQPSDAVLFARKVITKEIPPPDAKTALEQAAQLKRENRFDLARRVLAMAAVTNGDPLFTKVRQQVANCTYKDEDVPMPHRFHEALRVLREDCGLDTAKSDSETLGLGGAIYKRLFAWGGQHAHLERTLGYYHAAWVKRPQDDGYVGINTAFALDLLGAQEIASAEVPPNVPDKRFTEADQIRTELIAQLTAQGGPAYTPEPWWYYASLGEAALGLGRFAEAITWLQQGRACNPAQWQLESTARQLAMLTRIQRERRPDYDGAEALEQGLGVSAQAISSLLLGKVGLALSGGGFRASLFHIGVLARMAELDVLRHVEVLSCVSGGSIIGAFYYLALKNRLEAKSSLTQDDYIALVQEVEEKFLAGVQTNIRTSIATLPAGLRMAFQQGYSRTSRAGDLYDRKLYCNIDQVSDRAMKDLLVRFPEEPGFKPKYDNWKRDSKVPILVLNATTLNTGHNWQFTASWMGESPQAINGAIDAIPRLRRMYYDGDDVPGDYGRFPLGHAVGASACVPGLFEPIPLPELYPDRTVRLVDGGVHDNQGLASLLEQSCNVVLISDASGQSQQELNPKGSILGVTSRTNDLLQFRIREAQHDQLQALMRSGAIEGLMFIHLTSELETDAISWIGAKDRDDIPQNRDATTSYGVDRIVQQQLAEVRTDLDSFSDAEAYALMMSGYLMAGDALLKKGCAPTLPMKEKKAPSWRFFAVEEAMTKPESQPNTRMRRLLRVSNKLPLKIWRQSSLPYIVTFALLVVLAGLSVLVWGKVAVPSRAQVGWAAAGLLGLIAVSIAPAMLFAKKRIDEVLLGWLVATVLAVLGWLHVTVYDQMFLWHGSWEPRKSAPPSAFAAPGSPKLQIKATPAAKPARPTPVVRRVLNMFSPR